MVRQCEENERGTHSEKNAIDVDIPGKRRRGRANLRWKDACKRDMPCTGCRVKRGQRNKQDKMEKEANQLYRRPQMTGQARDEEDRSYTGWHSVGVGPFSACIDPYNAYMTRSLYYGLNDHLHKSSMA